MKGLGGKGRRRLSLAPMRSGTATISESGKESAMFWRAWLVVSLVVILAIAPSRKRNGDREP